MWRQALRSEIVGGAPVFHTVSASITACAVATRSENIWPEVGVPVPYIQNIGLFYFSRCCSLYMATSSYLDPPFCEPSLILQVSWADSAAWVWEWEALGHGAWG